MGVPNIALGRQKETAATTSKLWEFDLIQLVILLAVTFFSVYYTPPVVNRLVFLVFLPLAYRSNKDFLWLAWFFIIIDAPGRLFSATAADDLRIPLYSLAGGVSLEFSELFLFTYLLKFFIAKPPLKFVFKPAFKVFGIVILLFLFYSLLLGMGAGSIVDAVKYLLPWGWVVIVPYFVDSPEKVFKATRLLLPIVFLALISQIYVFTTGQYWDYVLRETKFRFSLSVEDGGRASRASSSVYIILFCLIQALFYLASDKKMFKSDNYLAAVVFCAAISIFLSATRGWILAFGLLIFCSVFYLFRGGKSKKLLNLGIASAVILYILQWSVPLIQYQFEAALERFSTLLLLVDGDVTAGGTLERLSVRGKLVMKRFNISPIIGWGFSDGYFDHADAHVGQQNILLNVGVVGFIYLNILYFYFCIKTWLYARAKAIQETWGKALTIYVFGFLIIFLIHGSSSQFWGFIMHFDQTDKIMTYSFIFASISALVLSVYDEGEPHEAQPNSRPAYSEH